MKKDKLFMIISISVLVMCIIGSSYALYTKTLSNDIGINTNTPGLDKYIIYEKGEDINGTLNTSATYVGGKNSSIKFYKKDNTYDIYGEIVLTINSIGTNLSNSSALKYVLVNNDKVLSEGSLNGVSAGSKITIINNLFLETTEQIYTIYVWLDINEELGNISGETLDISVDCSANMVPETLATYITKSYDNTTKTVITNNSIEYNYATSVSLMNDREGGTTSNYDGGNIRYYGASPNNYIYFNCSDYSNQTSDTCELWRIIGVFNGKVKIIRNSSIGSLPWDVEDSFLLNEWSVSSLEPLLNEKYYNGDTSGTITVPSAGGGSTTLNLTDIGIKNDATRNMISEEIYYLRGHNSNLVYSNEIYNYERTTGTETILGIANWTGKIALAYASDYGYAADLGKCIQTLRYYDDSTCTSNNWMKSIFIGKNWLINFDSHSAINAFMVEASGAIYVEQVNLNKNVTPVLYLNSNVISDMGNGTSANPYRLRV